MAQCSTACSVPGPSVGTDLGQGQHLRRDRVPDGPGAQVLGGQVQLLVAQGLAGRGVPSAVADDLAADLDAPEGEVGPTHVPLGVDLSDADVGLGPGLGPLAAVVGLDHRSAGVEVELGDLPVPPLVQVDRTGVDLAGRPPLVDGADELVVVTDAGDDADLGGEPAAQADAVGGPARAAPDGGGRVPPGSQAELVVEHEAADAVVEQVAPPALVGRGQRVLVGRAGQVREQDVGVGGVDDGRLRRPGEDLGGVGHQPLVELVVAGHEHGHGLLALAPGPARLLPQRGDGAGEAVEHAGVEAADVDAELEGGGGHDGPEAPGEQLGLDLAPLGGQVAAAVGGARCPAAPGGAGAGPRRPRPRPPGGCGRRRWCGGRRGPCGPPGRPSPGWSTAWGRRAPGRRRGPSGRCPPSASTAGFHRATRRSPWGEPSSVISATGSPQSSEARRPGRPMVAEQNTKVGSEP